MGRGPARTGGRRRAVDAWDAAELARSGRNALAVEVLRWGREGPHFDVSQRLGLLLQAGPVASGVSPFRALPVPGFNRGGPPAFPRVVHVAGNWLEDRDERELDPAWREPAFDDGAWAPARALWAARDPDSPWELVPRPIPALAVEPARDLRVVQRGTVEPPRPEPPFGFAVAPAPGEPGALPLRLPGDGRVHYLALDAGRLVTAEVEVVLDAPRGARAELMWAEAPSLNGRKGRRDALDGQRVEGYADRWATAPGRAVLEPATYRAFRFARLAVASDGPVEVLSARARGTGYPLERRGSFACSDPLLERIFDAGFETCRLCAHETYEDSPYYERLQYVADARVQALVGYVAAGEERLPELALRELALGRAASGLLCARNPCRGEQVIPGFACAWIEMLEEHHLHTGRGEVARELLPVALEVLEVFRGLEDAEGCLTGAPGWNFLDWSFDKGLLGEPGDVDVPLSLAYLAGLRAAARTARRLGDGAADALDARALRLGRALLRRAFDGGSGRFRDGVVRRTESVHANALALALGLPPVERRDALARWIAGGGEPGVTRPATFYFGFHVQRALIAAGRPDLAVADARRWRAMLELGATTWFETYEDSRSDCHGWSAGPTWSLPVALFGVRPTAPGWSAAEVAPAAPERLAACGVAWARARLATPRGELGLELEDGGRRLALDVPEGVVARVRPPGHGEGDAAVEVRAGRTELGA